MDLVAAVNPRSLARITATPGFAILKTQSGQYSDLIMRKDIGPGTNPDFILGMKYLFDREQMKKTIALDQAVVANDQPDRSNQPLLLRGFAAAPVRSGEGQVPSAEVGRHGRGAGRRVAGGTVLRRDGAGDAADGEGHRSGSRRQAHARRRLLEQSLAEQPGRLRQRQSAAERRRAPDAVLQVGRAVERVALQEREVRPAAASRHAPKPTTPSASRCTPTCRP